MATSEKKATVTAPNGAIYQAYTNGKEYGPSKIVYINLTKISGNGPSQTKGSYSIAKEEFVDFRAGNLDEIKAAARALGFI